MRSSLRDVCELPKRFHASLQKGAAKGGGDTATNPLFIKT